MIFQPKHLATRITQIETVLRALQGPNEQRPLCLQQVCAAFGHSRQAITRYRENLCYRCSLHLHLIKDASLIFVGDIHCYFWYTTGQNFHGLFVTAVVNYDSSASYHIYQGLDTTQAIVAIQEFLRNQNLIIQ